eukprot:CAMPEP_0202023628 /NCGR_PEP_ID=MMETSP0905-20130828/52305_1 /ASSEMBLY_ACC=CAM_ASM_000554 /TAXON_ID=420261 /ORGANISM="Thalassiosira antarctica, Strain CCMP982" /LENGTH=166 /DNA_ID=CAMNT_0048586049 /DNA_START=17 /DNA_END=514 /DNA_ORIENTATION=-
MIIAPSFSSAIANTATKATSCFVYGTLMSPEVLETLLGRVPTTIPKAILQHHSRHPVRGRVYPGVIPTPGSTAAVGVAPTTINTVEGVLLLGIEPLEMICLDYFEDEGVDYTRSNVQVTVPHVHQDGQPKNEIMSDYGEYSKEGTIETNAYIWALGASELDSSCDW